MRKPRFPARLAGAAEQAARLIARDVLHNSEQTGAEDMIGLALWLESLSRWQFEQLEQARIKREKRKTDRRDRNRPE